LNQETGTAQALPWGDERAGGDGVGGRANLDHGLLGPAPVGAYPAGASPCGALGMSGDVWEWTSTDFRGYDGFVAHPYREYSEVFFGDRYKVLRGGSWASRSRVVTPTFRNWDLPYRRQIFSGVRLAWDG
jgi:gamma-glutamyl hercynylcysteine S-oxide synthase